MDEEVTTGRSLSIPKADTRARQDEHVAVLKQGFEVVTILGLEFCNVSGFLVNKRIGHNPKASFQPRNQTKDIDNITQLKIK